ncbi:MAG: nitrite/sulfite reductase [Methylicorpusculum sp.]|uniref:nitrite/sulfite reductase n=2 Tax=Methylicorpusculum sp. TaxID=2713644 RepID=UPI00271CD910|nr:nitrite/sulfite reductase [Methylicorpusculum sp.]MDO8938659.1 nitrite/sulfite reductase [Methylicorpusculum sp.]MDO9241765.1 nitrite/sulfite reductase [Methylicorpusculum sp.]MDP2179252.1 nitrite/sulfite reductase [Methylicorpusculum sp.]MDP2200446.1 nitrite/sulfite reductase [Methylicorpusculum sp.]MDP3530034.1 nitrite/sulfite reductase [Methylicorpusculum sp.]
MYQYNQDDQTLINERVAQFRSQTERFLKGELDADQFRALRLMNGLYIQIHAPMLRVAIPYGLLSSTQLRKLAHIARKYDKGYCHFTTRQNVQYNWPKLEEVPDILAELAEVQMHAIQTSGNCMRNTTSDHLAGICKDEIEDPRPYCEIIRQWTTLHPEFAYLPRKFKIAVSGALHDRAATQFHDIGLHLVKNEQGETGFKVFVGGGLGRTPVIGQVIRPYLEKRHLLSYLEAILRIYNLFGRRDNKYKARIKILVKEEGLEKFKSLVDEEWHHIKDGMELSDERIHEMQAHFVLPHYDNSASIDSTFPNHLESDNAFATWVKHNTVEHKVPGYRAAFVSLKAPDEPPGDITDSQLEVVADLADRFSFGEVRSTHRQNLVFADVKQADLFDLWQQLNKTKMATPNIGTATDIICCPGLDFCSLANAGSIGITREINETLDNLDYLHDLGDIKINISGCMNGCAHQSVGHIGILGVDKKGEEWYQITLGGSSENEAAIGERLGPSVPKDQIAQAVAAILDVYVKNRIEDESFLDMVKRAGLTPFKKQVYANH